MDSMWDKSRKRNTWVTQWLFKMLVGTKFSSCVWIANSFIEMLLKGKFWVSVKKKMVDIISDVDHVSRWRKHWDTHHVFVILQFSSVAQSCLTLCDPMNCSMLGLPVHHQLLEFTQTHVHRVGDAIQPFHPLSSLSPPSLNPSHHQSLFQWGNSSHKVAKVLEF